MGPSANSSWILDFCISESVVILLRAWLAIYVILLPLFLYVLYVGYRQWKNQPSAPSHTDVFTIHIIAMEILTVISTCLYSLGIQARVFTTMRIGDYLFVLCVTGQMGIHSLACVERYLAVVHPITYLQLKNRGGVMIRNTCIAVVWLHSAAFMSLKSILNPKQTENIPLMCVTLVSAVIVSFCSVSVLCVLIRPGPAEGGGESKRVGQLKRRAFFTMIAITGVLMLRCVVLLSVYLVTLLQVLPLDDSCMLMMSASWFYFPSSLVLPLMFLHKAGKLPKCPR